jgi:aminoglycoside/choline kinase family phosphotransferase
MQMTANNPGILDFQDAVCGPYTYDLVSLLKDCYIAWPSDRVTQWALSFYAKRKTALGRAIDEDTFLRHFHLMGVQRQLKAAGIFARLNHRDGKPDYMFDIPLTLNYVVAISERYEELSFLSALICERILPQLAGATE